MNPTKAFISLKNFKYNLQNIKKHVGNKKMLIAVKGDAYGHGAVRLCELIEKDKLADYLGVATSGEGLILRKANIKLPILKFTQCFPEELEELIQNNIEIAVYSEDFLEFAADITKKNNKELKIHIKIDTGMGRVGITKNSYKSIISILKKNPQLKTTGFMTHFAAADFKKKDFTILQNKRFMHAIEFFKKNGINPEIIHAANSGAVIDHPDTWYDMVRPGIICYGYYPSNETSETIKIKPVMTLTSVVSFIKKVAANTPISYSMTYKTPEKNYIATIPVGYGDGYSRLLSNRGKVSIKTREYKVCGRICMDQFMVDIGKN
ncbi:MAG: alanine racemase, partial [Candidatus Muirbacterium halophilum]|nr:alanine racemase [Candidatus Muirbacterium halophilum]